MRVRSIWALILCQALLVAQQLPPTPSSGQTPGSPGSPADPLAQQVPGTPAPSNPPPVEGKNSDSPVLQSIEKNDTKPVNPRLDNAHQRFFFNYGRVTAPDIHIGPASRVGMLVRNGKIYLSLYDAVALAIENNLDVEVARYGLSITGTELERAQGGGT